MSNLKNHLEKEYSIECTDIQEIKSGVINKNYHIFSESGEYIFRICNLRTKEQAQFEVDLLDFLKNKDFPCPKILKAKSGGSFSVFGNKPALVYPFISGAVLSKWDETILSQVGSLTGKLHRLSRDFSQNTERQTWEYVDIKKYIESESEKIIEKDFCDGKNFTKYIKNEFETFSFEDGLPIGITHQDIKPENIIKDESGELHIIDFDNAYRGILLHDLMTPVIWMCFPEGIFNSSYFISFLKGYNKERQLEKMEKEQIFDALCYRLVREAFVWAMRFSPSVAEPKSYFFLEAYKNFKDKRREIEKIIENL